MIIQNVDLSDLKFKTIISKTRYCISIKNDCEIGTYLTYYKLNNEIEKEFVCLKCNSTKYKIIKFHKYFYTIPFDTEQSLITFHQNIQSPYFVCGEVNTPVPDCEYYMDYTNKEAPYDGKIFIFF